MLTYLLFFAGFAILIYGAKLLIDGASSIGTRAGLPQLIIGLSIVAMGTSLPELVINIFASIRNSSELAIGNVIGSNIMNTLLIVGVTAIIYPIKVNSIVCKRDSWVNLIAILVMAAVANDAIFNKGNNSIDAFDGIILLLLFVALLYMLFTSKDESLVIDLNTKVHSYWRSAIEISFGVIGLFFGGKWIVDGVSAISTDLGISESTIGMTIIAIATSLPELVTSVIAALKKNTDIAIGNALGSNIFNIFLVLGVSATISPIPFESSLNIQIGILLIASLFLILTIRTGKTKRTITRIEGIILSLAYFIFLIWTLL